jgi:membrane protease YdiL (CAAX protease family)
MSVKKASLCLFSLYLAMFLFNEAFVLVKPLFEPITQMGFLMMNKTIFALGLLIFVYTLKIQRQCGLVFKANWRTLPLYWPMALIAGSTLTTGINTDTSGSMLAIIFMTVLAGSFVEELMFRGLVFHWFRDVSVRKQILISAFGFGGLHLLGLTSGIEPAVIFAQIYLAASFGIIFGYARARDYSIMIPTMVHVMFNFITLGSKGGVAEAASSAPTEQVVIGMMAVGTFTWAWGGFLLWKAGKNNIFATTSLNTLTT